MKFKYNDRIYNPSNLEKKLKKLGITINDIEIIPEPKIDTTPQLEFPDLEHVNIKSTKDNIIRVCQVPKGTRPPIIELFRNHIYNPDTKTGVYTLEEINTFYYE